jgi:hypothetical protein
MDSGFSIAERGAGKIRFGGQMLHHARLRRHLLKEVSELEAHLSALEQSQDTKHQETIHSYCGMILERLQILHDLFIINERN